MRDKVVILTIKGKEVELTLDDFPIPIRIKDRKTGKCEADEKRTLDARIKNGEVKIRIN